MTNQFLAKVGNPHRQKSSNVVATKSWSVLIPALLIAACGCATGSDNPYANGMTHQESEAISVYMVVMDHAQKHGGRIPAFDTRSLPAWANPRLLDQDLHQVGFARAYKRALKRPWSYKVPDNVVGMDAAKIPAQTIVVQDLAYGPKADLLGIRMDLLPVMRQRPSQPAP